MPPSNENDSTLEQHGWPAVSRSLSTLLSSRPRPTPSTPLNVSDIPVPQSPLIDQVTAYAKQRLSRQTFHHSMRVYYFSRAMLLQHFPSRKLSDETLLLTVLLHDIATADEEMQTMCISWREHGFETPKRTARSADPEGERGRNHHPISESRRDWECDSSHGHDPFRDCFG